MSCAMGTDDFMQGMRDGREVADVISRQFRKCDVWILPNKSMPFVHTSGSDNYAAGFDEGFVQEYTQLAPVGVLDHRDDSLAMLINCFDYLSLHFADDEYEERKAQDREIAICKKGISDGEAFGVEMRERALATGHWLLPDWDHWAFASITKNLSYRFGFNMGFHIGYVALAMEAGQSIPDLVSKLPEF